MSPAPTPQWPRIWNIPLNRNPNFTGRDKLLNDLHSELHSDRAAALTQTQAIHGLGGIGKTQIAAEYAYRHASEYDIVWWVHAEQATALAEELAGLARMLDLPQKDARDQSVVIQAVHGALRQREKWLVVFDNATGPTELHDFLPQGPGHVIITSRHYAWRGVACPLWVEAMEPVEAIDFLLKRTGQTDRDAAGKLAEALGDLPLALEQAGAYIEERRMPMADYLTLFAARRKELLELNRPLDYPATVATTWVLSFEQVEKESAAASALMNLCAFFAPDDIPLELIRNGNKHLPAALGQAVADELELSKANAALLRFSLISRIDETISVHRLVQAVTRDRLDEPERKQHAQVAAQIVNDAFPGGDITTNPACWSRCARLLPHALAVAEHATELGVAAKPTARILNQSGLYLKTRARFTDAKACFERALKIDEATYGPDHPEVAKAANNLGSVLQDMGDLAGAKACYERALKIDEASYGPDHPEVAKAVNNLGSVLQDMGDLPGAKACYERALKIDEASYGPDHPEVATDVNNLGSVLRATGDLPGAKACFDRALKINEASYGPDHPSVASYVNNLGSVLQDLGDLPGAKACFDRALKIDEASYGPDHPTVAIRVNNLGGVLQDLGDLPGAKACYERALLILRKYFGDDHPNVETVRGNLESLGSVEQEPTT